MDIDLLTDFPNPGHISVGGHSEYWPGDKIWIEDPRPVKIKLADKSLDFKENDDDIERFLGVVDEPSDIDGVSC